MSDWEDPPSASGGGWEDPAPPKAAPAPKLGDLVPAVALNEGAASIASGMVAAPIAGLSGIAAAFAKALKITDTEAADVVRKVQDALTYQPASEAGKKVASVVSYPFEKLAEVGDAAGEKVADATGSPALGAATTTAIQSAPMAITPAARRGGAKVAAMEDAAAAERAKVAALERPVRENIEEFRQLGFVITPNEAKAGPIARSAEGFSGSAKLQKGASVENGAVVNDLIRKDVRLADNEPLTMENLATRREAAGAPYDALRELEPLKVDKAYKDSGLGPQKTSTWEHNPAMDPKNSYTISAADAVESIKQLRSEASGYYSAWKRDQKPETLKMAEARSQAAAEVEALIERNLTERGQPELLAEFRDARTQFAKIHQAELALNETTGNIDARVYGQMLRRDKNAEAKGTLTGGALAVAKFARQFEKLVQPIEKVGHRGLDFGDIALAAMKGMGAFGGVAAGAAAGGATGGAGVVGALLARPATRAALLSDVAQDALAKPKSYDRSAASAISQAALEAQGLPGAGAAETATSQQRKRRRDQLLRTLGE